MSLGDEFDPPQRADEQPDEPVGGPTSSNGHAPDDGETESDAATFEGLVAIEVARIRVREAAKQRYIQESTAGVSLPEFIQLDEFLAQPDDNQLYLVNGIWPKGGHILMVAQQKAGKTTLRNKVVKSLCDGYDFLNRFRVSRPKGRIVVLDLELPKTCCAAGCAMLGYETNRSWLLCRCAVKAPASTSASQKSGRSGQNGCNVGMRPC
jgi:AAA domain-containing protein